MYHDGCFDLAVKPTVQDIAVTHCEDFLEKHPVNQNQRRALQAISACRTPLLGENAYVCPNCDHVQFAYRSCGNRHCPQCQTADKELWLEKKSQDLLNCGYFHVVFTVPDLLNPAFLANPEEMLALLMKTASQSLLEVCADHRFLGAMPGVIAVLHTWGQTLAYHPHVHMIVTAGGLRTDFSAKADESKCASWIPSRKPDFLVPVKVLSAKFKGKFLALFKESIAYKRAPNSALLNNCYAKKWEVYCKPPYGSAQQVLAYLGRYTHRVAISNDRILKVENNHVSFRWRDYAHNNEVKVMTLSCDEFLRRFSMHILPRGFHKIRSYGLFAPRLKTRWLPVCRRFTRTPTPPAPKTKDQILRGILGPDYDLCPCCREGRLVRLGLPFCLGPPEGILYA